MYMTQEKDYFYSRLKRSKTVQEVYLQLAELEADDCEGFVKEWLTDFKKGITPESIIFKNRQDAHTYYFK